MDNATFRESLKSGLSALGVELSAALEEGLVTHHRLLMQWNPRVNLTAVTDPREAAEKHFVDSLALLPEMEGGSRLLDLGSGAGFPGVPLKLARPALQLQLVDTVAKKVGFLKQLLATLGVGGAQALHARAEGQPSREGIIPADRVTARAVAPLERLLPWLRPYVAPGGRCIASLGVAEGQEIEATAKRLGWEVVHIRPYTLPFSGARRVCAVVCPV